MMTTLGALAQEAKPSAVEGNTSVPEESASGGNLSAASKVDSDSQVRAALQGIQDAIVSLKSGEGQADRQEVERRERADLQAQEEMALWARWMAWAAFASVVLTAVGVALIWRTLVHTRVAANATADAVSEARKATKAAEDAVTVTREIGINQLRAYVSIESFEARIHPTTGIAPIFLVYPKWKNAGQSYATEVTIHVAKGFSNSSEIIPQFTFDRNEPATSTPIGPQMSVSSEGITLDVDEMKSIMNGSRYAFCHGICRYTDIFGTRHKTEFCVRPIPSISDDQVDWSFDEFARSDAIRRLFTFRLANEKNSVD